MTSQSFPGSGRSTVLSKHAARSSQRVDLSRLGICRGKVGALAGIAIVLFAAVACAALLCAGAVAAAGLQVRGDLTAKQILDSIEGKGSLAGNGRAVVEMVVERGKSQKLNRVEVMRSDDGNGTTKQLVEFLAPADVRGMKFLSITAPGEEDQMWLYLPAVGSERRIAGSAASGKFMGTDFTFEEISASAKTWEPYKPERMPDETVDGQKCYVLRLMPESGNLPYGAVTIWIWQENVLPLRIEFFNNSKKLQKVMTFSDLKKNKSGEWQPHTIVLQDILGGSLTTVRILEMDDRPVPDEVFTLRYLRKR